MDGTLTTTVMTGGLMTAFEVATKDAKHEMVEAAGVGLHYPVETTQLIDSALRQKR